MDTVNDVMGDYDEMSTASIVSYARDYFKDVYGFRPSIRLDCDSDIRAYYIGMILECEQTIQKMSKTDGWNI